MEARPSFIERILSMISKELIMGILALGIIGGLMYKFMDSDVQVPVDAIIGLAGIVIGFYFGRQTNGTR